jgi:hypothetical protein
MGCTLEGATKEPELCYDKEVTIVHQLMSECNS